MNAQPIADRGRHIQGVEPKQGTVKASAAAKIRVSDENIDPVLIDVNALGIAAMHAPSLSKLSRESFPTAALHGVSDSIVAHLRDPPRINTLVINANEPHVVSVNELCEGLGIKRVSTILNDDRVAHRQALMASKQ